jgi:hypothetical protein
METAIVATMEMAIMAAAATVAMASPTAAKAAPTVAKAAADACGCEIAGISLC